MKFGILKERKNPPDKRVVFSPDALLELQEKFPDFEVAVESSEVRIFTDEEYKAKGIQVSEDVSDCDVLLGVKEVPVENLIPNKKYFFFSHTIKKQPHNRSLLQAILAQNIELYDHETIVDSHNIRLIGFGKYAGYVGTYNAFRGFGLKYDLFTLPKAGIVPSKEMLIAKLKRQMLPNIKIVVTGHGKVGGGVVEILNAMKIKLVSVDDFLSKIYTQPVYVHIDVHDYNKRKDGSASTPADFYKNPQDYESDFRRFSEVADIYIAGHFHATSAPNILTADMLASHKCTLKVVADISCDVDGSVACTLRTSTNENPFYGYLPSEHKEVAYTHPASIMVMAVDNLPSELPKDASEGFGEQFAEHVIPAFYNGDKEGVLQRAKITENGKLTPRFAYLQEYVGIE